MASSKKPGSPRSKSSAAKKAGDPKIEDAVILEDGSVDADKADKASGPASDAAKKINVTGTGKQPTETKPDEPAPEIATDNQRVIEGVTPEATDSTTKASDTDQETVGAPETETKGDASKTPMAEMVHPMPVPAPEQPRNNVFLPLVLGGLIAGIIGFMASELDMFDDNDAAITTQLRGDLNAQQERIVVLEGIKPAQMPEATPVDLSGIETQIEDITARIAALEERPVVTLPENTGADIDAAAAYAEELRTLKSAVEAQRDEIAGLLDTAKTVEEATAEAAKAANAQATITKIISAIDAGQPFAGELTRLKALDVDGIDPALEATAADGVTTLAALQAEFPERARKALSAARASGAAEGEQGIGSFLRRQLGARSVTPRDGDDPDAVLSRAEAALQSGALFKTLAELDTLPEEAQSVISDWRAAAEARVSARNAADALAQRLTAD